MKRKCDPIDLPQAKVPSSSGLCLIQQYDDDDDKDDDAECEPSTIVTGINESYNEVVQPLARTKKLKSPSEISKMFLMNDCDGDDNNTKIDLHGGRIRSFAHVRGNWASFISLPFPEDCDNIVTMYKLLTDVALSSQEQQQKLNIDLISSPHVSLSKTLVFRHHWLDPFILDLKNQLLNCDRLMIAFDEFNVYINDEKTRTFIGMKLHPCPGLVDLLKICDSCLSEFNLESYYKDPSFHISLGSIVGDHFSTISQHILPELNKKWKLLLKQDETLKFYTCTMIDFKYGNKISTFNLN